MLKLLKKSKDIHSMVKISLTSLLGTKISNPDWIEWTTTNRTHRHLHLPTKTHVIKSLIKICMNQIQITHFVLTKKHCGKKWNNLL